MPVFTEIPPSTLALVGAVALAASMLSAVSGFGSAALLLPVLALALGEKEAVPVLTIAQAAANAGKAWFNRRELRWSAAGWYLLSAVPAAALGSLLFVAAPARALSAVMGAFLLLAVAWRRVRRASAEAAHAPMPERRLWIVGAFTGALSALVGGAGPIAAPFFLAAGLVKGAYIGTEALAALGVHAAKLAAFGGAGLLEPRTLALGLALTPITLAGALVGKRLVDRLAPRVFVAVVEWTLVVAAAMLLWRAARG